MIEEGEGERDCDWVSGPSVTYHQVGPHRGEGIGCGVWNWMNDKQK